MSDKLEARFLSLFVADLRAAAARYRALLGPEVAPRHAPDPHPFASAGPVVFRLGELELALYQADGRTTHPGDSALGVEAASVSATLDRGREAGFRATPARALGPAQGRAFGLLVSAAPHFLELVSPPPGAPPSPPSAEADAEPTR